MKLAIAITLRILAVSGTTSRQSPVISVISVVDSYTSSATPSWRRYGHSRKYISNIITCTFHTIAVNCGNCRSCQERFNISRKWFENCIYVKWMCIHISLWGQQYILSDIRWPASYICFQEHYSEISKAHDAILDGTLVGVIHFHRNMSEALERRIEDFIYAEDGDLVASQIQISLDTSGTYVYYLFGTFKQIIRERIVFISQIAC